MTRVIVAGALANKPGNGGEAWVRTNWIRGLQRLGLDVWFVEVLAPAAWGEATPSCIEWFRSTVEFFDIGDRSVLLHADGDGAVLAGSTPASETVHEGADLLVNISGLLGPGPIFERCRHRAYVDLDPGYTQIWHHQGADLNLLQHHSHFSVGLNLGRPDCGIPVDDVAWRAVLPPVLLDEWAPQDGGVLDRFTTVASWRGGYGVIEHEGVRHGAKAHEFRRFIDLPERVAAALELALHIHPADDADRRSLLEHGWHLVDIDGAVGSPDRYRNYLRSSPAELSVAQGVYVHTRSGWFSDRTAHYLAAGRPALVQDTGCSLDVDDFGIVVFDNPDGAAAGAARMADRYDEHRAGARRFAEEHLDAGRVLARFLDQTGVNS